MTANLTFKKLTSMLAFFSSIFLFAVNNAKAQQWSTDNLSVGRLDLAATSSGSKVFFGGGRNIGFAMYDVVDISDVNTSTWTTSNLSEARSNLAATSAMGKVFLPEGEGDIHLMVLRMLWIFMM